MISSQQDKACWTIGPPPQGRVTDHRIGLTLYDLQNIVNGDLDKLVDEIQLHYNTEKLKVSGELI